MAPGMHIGGTDDAAKVHSAVLRAVIQELCKEEMKRKRKIEL